MHIFNDIPQHMKLGLSDDANGKSSTFPMNCNAIGYTNKLCGHPVTGEYTGELRCDEFFYTEISSITNNILRPCYSNL